MRRCRGIRIALARLTPQLGRQGLCSLVFDAAAAVRYGVDHRRGAVGTGGIDVDFLAMHAARIVAANSGGEGQQLAQLDVGLGRIRKRKRLGGHISGLKDLLIEAIGEQLGPLCHEDADGDAGERFSARGKVGGGVAVGQAKVPFINEPAILDDEKAAILGAGFGDFERIVELRHVDASQAASLVRRRRRSPAAGHVGRGEIRRGGICEGRLVVRRLVVQRFCTRWGRGGDFVKGRIEDRIVGRAVETKRKSLVMFLEHQAITRAAGHGGDKRRRRPRRSYRLR